MVNLIRLFKISDLFQPLKMVDKYTYSRWRIHLNHSKWWIHINYSTWWIPDRNAPSPL